MICLKLLLLRTRRLFSLYRVASLLCLVCLSLVVYGFKLHIDQPWYYHSTQCSQPQAVIEDILVAADKVHKLLDRNSVHHFLCYGALWGALRNSKPLPQDDDVDFCVLSEDLEGIEEGYLYQLFKFDGMILSYDPKNGVYTVRIGQGKVNLVLFALSEDYQWLQRIGVVNRLLFAEAKQKFPSALAAPPLPTVKLNWVELPAPRHRSEIQKYFYPNDWWKEVRPPGC